MLLCLLTAIPMATFAHQPGQPPRRRIALLHGTAGSEKTLRIQLGPLLPKLQETWDVAFVEGPKLCAEDNLHVKTMRRFYGPSAELREYAEATADDRGWRTYADLEDAVDSLETAVGGADCLLGFSQGANFASILAARAERRGAPYRAVVLLCGARPGWARQLPAAFERPLTTPALIGAGAQDAVVGNGDDLAALFARPERRTHAEGHRPLPAADAAAYADSVARFLEWHGRADE